MLKYGSVSYYLSLMLCLGCFLTTGVAGSFYLMDSVVFLEWGLFSVSGVSVVMVILFDWMSLSFVGFVLFISSMVLMYSFYYMEGDKYIYRFIILVYLFVLSMLLMVLSPNMISILLGWDGLGLVSYCLVIYYQGVKSANAGMLTILSNRVGDVAILLSISWCLNFGSWNFHYLIFLNDHTDLHFVLCMVVLASMTKSAQVPFSAWLPAAMAAPTPVSALVHSSTLVTAGVYLMIRFNFLLSVNCFLFYLGVLTMFMSGLGANFEMDLKKIIALSTLSQLGVMMFILSLGFAELAFFHLLSHALFKSLLFLCAGVYIHGVGDCQDIRFLGGVMGGMPLSSLFFVGCSLSLCGFPFLSGFYSKDLILESHMMGFMNSFMVIMITVGTFFTVTYSLRLSAYLYLKNLGLRGVGAMGDSAGLAPPMTILFVVSVGAGAGLSWLCFPVYNITLPLGWKILFLLGLLSLIILTYKISMGVNFDFGWSHQEAIWFLGGMWFMPSLSTGLFMKVLKLGESLLKYLDQGWVEKMGGQGLILELKGVGASVDFLGVAGAKNFLLGAFTVILIFIVILY